MSKKRSGRRRSGGDARRSRAVHRSEPGHHPVAAPIPRAVLFMLVLAVAGIALTAYLTAVKLFGATPLACGVGSDCDVVQSSRWSTLLGMPIAAWGLLTYAVIAGLIWRARRLRRAWAQAWVVAIVGLAISVYLTVVSVIEIEAACLYCLASLGMLAALVAGLSVLRPAASGEPALRAWVPGSAIAAIAVVAGMHAHFSGLFDPAAGPEKRELRALAEHLGRSGARFYGAYWCPHCNDQKALFEASVKRLPYVECTPDGRNGPRALECVTNNVNAYPTWIIGGRRYEQIMDPPELARITDFDWPAAQVAGR